MGRLPAHSDVQQYDFWVATINAWLALIVGFSYSTFIGPRHEGNPTKKAPYAFFMATFIFDVESSWAPLLSWSRI